MHKYFRIFRQLIVLLGLYFITSLIYISVIKYSDRNTGGFSVFQLIIFLISLPIFIRYFINIFLSRQDLASYTGTTYETVFRTMNEFTEANIIAVDNKNITILDSNKLQKFTEQI